MNPSDIFFHLELWYLKLVILPSKLNAVSLKLFVGYKKPQLFGYMVQSYFHLPFKKTASLTSMLSTDAY